MDAAGVRFFDGMRVTREHLEHLQALARNAAELLALSLGSGAAYGLRAAPAGPDSVQVDPGAALDGFGRLLRLEEAATLLLPPTGKSHLVLVHRLRSELPYKGVPTLLHGEADLELRPGGPPYADGAVLFAEAEAGTPEAKVWQSGEWFLPPLRHGHTGLFRLDAQMRRRFDGAPLPHPPPDFDSGPLRVEPGESRELIHGLATRDLVVALECVEEGGTLSSRGLGSAFWHEIPSEKAIRACVAPNAPGRMLRARVWRCGAAVPGEPGAARPPLADAGDPQSVDGSKPFNLDGGRSRAFDGRALAKYIWTRIS